MVVVLVVVVSVWVVTVAVSVVRTGSTMTLETTAVTTVDEVERMVEATVDLMMDVSAETYAVAGSDSRQAYANEYSSRLGQAGA